MHRFGVWLTAGLIAVALVVLGLTVAPVSATIQVLCKGVSTADTAKCNPAYAKDMAKMHWRMYGGHNCTNYVAWQLTQNGVKEPSRLMGNARDWVANAKKEGYTVNSTPAVGSVGAWGTSKNHITYVVAVGSNYIITHEDNYPGYYPKGLYQELKIYKGDSSYPTQFIHFKDFIAGGSATITGTPKVGQALTSNNGTWNPSGVTFLYRWLRDGVAIADGTKSSYALGPADVGHRMSYRVRAQKSGYVDRVVTSAATVAVAPGTITNTAMPAVSGGPSVGSALSATAGSWTPSGLSYAFQWLRDGAAIPGANSATYPLLAADVGAKVTVRVSAARPGYTTLARTAADAVAVDSGTMVNSAAPAISGTLRVGSTVTAADGSWTPSGATLTRSWLAGGVPIPGATGRTHVLTSADQGKPITVQVTAVKPGYKTTTTSSKATAPVLPKLLPTDQVVKTTGHVEVRKDGAGTVNISCTQACSGWVQVWSDAKGSHKSDVRYYRLKKAGWMPLTFAALPYVDSATALTRIAKEAPKEAPNPQFNALRLSRIVPPPVPKNVVATTAGVPVATSGRATLNVSCTMACSGYIQLWSDAAGTKKSDVQRYVLARAGWMPLTFSKAPYVNSVDARARIAITAPLDGPTPRFNPLRLWKLR